MHIVFAVALTDSKSEANIRAGLLNAIFVARALFTSWMVEKFFYTFIAASAADIFFTNTLSGDWVASFTCAAVCVTFALLAFWVTAKIVCIRFNSHKCIIKIKN